MVGKDYDSLEEFLQACRNREEPLDPSYVLGKVYLIEHVRRVADWERMNFDNKSGIHIVDQSEHGIRNRYSIANDIALSLTAEQIGSALSHLDHEFYFPLVTYFRFPIEEPYTSINQFLRELSRNDIQVTDNFVKFFNGLTQPHTYGLKRPLAAHSCP